jgi:hypothetical protein
MNNPRQRKTTDKVKLCPKITAVGMVHETNCCSLVGGEAACTCNPVVTGMMDNKSCSITVPQWFIALNGDELATKLYAARLEAQEQEKLLETNHHYRRTVRTEPAKPKPSLPQFEFPPAERQEENAP